MHIGIPREVKADEYRVGLTPAGVRELTRRGHEVYVETLAGAAIGFSDQDYVASGAHIAGTAAEVFASAELIVKVKEPQRVEYERLGPGQALFTYLHLAADAEQTRGLVESGAVCIAYETVTDVRGGLPLLAPMSEVAGRMSIQAAATALEKPHGGSGILLGGVAGVPPARVLIIGGGVVGVNAARVARGMGAEVTIVDRSLPRLREIDNDFDGHIRTLYSTQDAIESELGTSDVVVGAVLIPGAAAPKLVTRFMLGRMQAGSVLVDVAIDQGGCAETSRPTTHRDPTYVVDGIVHYCVANMPGAVARTSTLALTHATLDHVIALATKGVRRALEDDPHLRCGLQVCRGAVTHAAVSEALGYAHVPADEALRSL